MKNFKCIAFAIVVAASCSITSVAQTNVRVVTAKVKTAGTSTGVAAIVKKYNQPVAPKGTPGTYGRNRAVVPGSANNINFSLKPQPVLRDSLGNTRGTVVSTKAKVNYGATRTMLGPDGKPAKYHYVWDVRLQNGDKVSGYLPRSEFKIKPKMPTVTVKRPPAGPRTPYTITGGNPESSKFGRVVGKDFEPYKVNPRYTGGGRNGTDYLRRPGDYVNQNFNLPGTGKGGVSHNVYPIGTTVHRVKSIPSYTVPLYNPGGTKKVSEMKFVLVTVRGTKQTMFKSQTGWVALDALKRRKP